MNIQDLIGQVPLGSWEWGYCELGQRRLLTVAVPLSDVVGKEEPMLVVLMFDCDKPLAIDSSTPFEVIIEDERCAGVSQTQTAYLALIQQQGGVSSFEEAIRAVSGDGISSRTIRIEVVHARMADYSIEHLQSMLKNPLLSEHDKEFIQMVINYRKSHQ